MRRLELWPAARRQCAEVLHAITPLTQVGGCHGGGGHGGSCGQYRDDFGWIYATADGAWGFAEGIVHEMAHWKLRALGVWFEEWTDLLLENKSDERYASPVRKDTLRPMGAVLHGQYSYVHVAQMVVHMLAAEPQPSPGDFEWVDLQLARIAEGQGTLRAHARGTPGIGDAFLIGLDDWTTRVLAAGRALVPSA